MIPGPFFLNIMNFDRLAKKTFKIFEEDDRIIVTNEMVFRGFLIDYIGILLYIEIDDPKDPIWCVRVESGDVFYLYESEMELA